MLSLFSFEVVSNSTYLKNLSTGGMNFHSIYEAIPVNAMFKMVEVIKNLVSE